MAAFAAGCFLQPRQDCQSSTGFVPRCRKTLTPHHLVVVPFGSILDTRCCEIKKPPDAVETYRLVVVFLFQCCNKSSIAACLPFIQPSVASARCTTRGEDPMAVHSTQLHRLGDSERVSKVLLLCAAVQTTLERNSFCQQVFTSSYERELAQGVLSVADGGGKIPQSHALPGISPTKPQNDAFLLKVGPFSSW